MSTETIWTGQVIVWALCAGMLGFFLWTVSEGFREMRAWQRTHNRIAEIGQQQALGARERITGEAIAERRR